MNNMPNISSLSPRQCQPPTKVTAAQIKKGCPTATEVLALGFRIHKQLKKVRSYEAKAQAKAGVELRKADDNWITVTQLLAEAKAKCNAGGFKAFKEKFCPNLSRSRIYQLLEIGTGKKTLEGSRAEKRAIVAKSRKKGKKVSTTDDVVDKSAVEPSPMQSNSPAPIEPPTNAEPIASPTICALTSEFTVTLGSKIESDSAMAEVAFEALSAHTVARVAQAIPPGKVALVTEIADYFTALATKLTTRSAGNGEAPVAISDSIPDDDLSIPDFLQRRGAS
jgi:hypothetical protein